MVKKKYKSKRSTLKDKYKIQKRVVDHHRKQRKQTKRDAKNGIHHHNSKKNKDPGIPNSWPFKQELLQEIEQSRELAEQRTLLKKQQKQQNKKQSLQDLMNQAQQDQTNFHNNNNNNNATRLPLEDLKKDNSVVGMGQQSRRAYLKELRKVMESSDVILQVLDARDPIGTRVHPTMEEMMLSHADKRMVLVLNKIDLVPKEAVRGWLAHLRNAHPTIAIKSGTKMSATKVGRAESSDALNSTCGVGVESLLQLLKNYARSGRSKTSITVGIVGYPNVGKSSLLNTLKRCRAVGVSPQPGFTKVLQEVVLDKTVRLLDSPGIVFDDDNSMLRNCINVDSIPDPIPPIQALLQKVSPKSFCMTYSIPTFPQNNVDMFLAIMSKQMGKVKKGGMPDKIGTARSILRDWNTGKIPYYTPPPTTTTTTLHNQQKEAKIVSSFDQEFNALYSKMDANVLSSNDDDKDEMDFVQLDQNALTAAVAKSKFNLPTDDDDDDMEEDEDKEQTATTTMDLANAEDYDFNDM